MKCWKCGGHMTKYSSFAVCDNCGRSVNRKTNSHMNSNNSDSSFSGLLGLLGIAGLATYAAKKIDSSNDTYSYQHTCDSDKMADSFSVRFKRFTRNTLYSAVACVLVLSGFVFFYFTLESSLGKIIPFYLSILTGLMLVWGGILIFSIKGRRGYVCKNIIGSVAANISCKIAGLFVAFADIDFLNGVSFIIRIIVGVCLFIAGHYVYKEIKDS